MYNHNPRITSSFTNRKKNIQSRKYCPFHISVYYDYELYIKYISRGQRVKTAIDWCCCYMNACIFLFLTWIGCILSDTITISDANLSLALRVQFIACGWWLRWNWLISVDCWYALSMRDKHMTTAATNFDDDDDGREIKNKWKKKNCDF